MHPLTLRPLRKKTLLSPYQQLYFNIKSLPQLYLVNFILKKGKIKLFIEVSDKENLMNRKQFLGVTLTGLATIIPLSMLNISSAVAQSNIDLTLFRNTALSQHNTYRATHHSPNMTSGNTLNTTAQSWADQMASSGNFTHSTSTQRNGAGENLYVYYTTGSAIAADALAGKALSSWYGENVNYNYNNPGFSSATGHFTQVVWKSSTQLGCGASKGTKTLNGTVYNAFYVVCHYAPAGNVTGQFPANVLKP